MEPEAYVEMQQAEVDHWWYRGMRRITQRLLSASLPPRRDLRILDAGCGTGGNLSFLGNFGRVYGIDYSMLALGLGTSTKIAQATIERLPFADSTFDVVTSFDVLYCREVGDDERALAEIARVLRPNGIALIRCPALAALRGPHDDKVHGARRYTLPQLRTKLIAAGLRPVRMTYANALLLPLAWLSRWSQQRSLMAGQTPESDLQKIPTAINTLLSAVLDLEAVWIGSGGSFPLGVSVIGLATKPR